MLPTRFSIKAVERSSIKGTKPEIAIIYGIFSPIFGLFFSGYSLYKISNNSRIKGMLISIIGLLLSIGMIILSIIGLSQLV